MHLSRRSALPPAKATAPDSAAAALPPPAAAAVTTLSAAQVASGRLWSAKVVLFSGVPEAALSAQDYKAFQVGRGGQVWGRVVDTQASDLLLRNCSRWGGGSGLG